MREDPLVREAIRLLNEEYEANKDFNESFEADEPVRIGRLEFPKSRALFWLDRDAYYEAQEEWKNDSLQDQHELCFTLLRANGLETPFSELAAAVERGRVVPFVGAGMSRPMGMPLWGDALRELLGRMPGANIAAINAQIDTGQYLAAAQALVEHDAVKAENFVSTKYRVQRIKLAGPMMLLPRVAKGCVITTNFDDAIEQAYGHDDVRFDAYMHGKQEHNFFRRLVRGDRCLLKLHGDADNPATHILTQAQYAEGYGKPFDFQKPLPKALRQVFVSQSLLFLGCSLEQDWTLELFEKAKQADEYAIPNHYAILPAPADAQAKQKKETRLLKLNIQPLWYPDNEHAFVERYLQLIIDVAERRISYNG
ncbi:MAG: SIR2 family protein [Lysobacterales bacterium]|nr:SIR2 family protein [Xanthomonadales bacterium]MCP5474106.1 SIR2 family protein [Rhodanobacteraceae bacterium]